MPLLLGPFFRSIIAIHKSLKLKEKRKILRCLLPAIGGMENP